MAKDLIELYTENYLNNSQVISEKNEPENDEDEKEPVAKKTGKKPIKKSKKDSFDAGKHYADSTNFDNTFGKILKEMDEEFGGGDDSTFEFGGEDDGLEDSVGSGDSYTLDELKNMTLQEITDLISGGGVGVGDEDDTFDDFGDDDLDEGDGIPSESVEHGDQGTYDGKAKKQGQSTHVKSNGDANVGKSQRTGYSPDDTEGHEGEEWGDQGEYDGKAKKQGQSSHVNSNGDAKVGKSQRTGYKTGSGKKSGDLF